MKQLFFLLLTIGLSTALWAQDAPQAPAQPAQETTAQAPADDKAPQDPQAQTAPAPEKTAQEAAPEKAAQETLDKDLAAAAIPAEEKTAETFVAARETVEEIEEDPEKEKVVYAPTSKRDPTLSPDDFLLLQYREQQRLAAIEAERKRKLEEERRRQEEAERLRQLELARIKDPTREVRNKIKIGGVIGQEVFIGSKIYTVGNSIYGARIVAVRPDEVVFSYKGHKFVRKVQL